MGMEVMSSAALDAALSDLAARLLAAVGEEDFALVGIYTGGAYLAERLQARIAALRGVAPRLGTMDITLYRDDLYTGLEKPVLGETDITFNVTDQGIVLVDDVLFTGRTVRAALHQLIDFGRPRWVKLLVLVDRGHRELPIAPDFVGAVVETAKQDRVTVSLVEDGAASDGVRVQRRVDGQERA